MRLATCYFIFFSTCICYEYFYAFLASVVYVGFDIIFLLCRHLGSQLSEMRNVIERMMEADFVDFAVANLNITNKKNDEIYEEVRQHKILTLLEFCKISMGPLVFICFKLLKWGGILIGF